MDFIATKNVFISTKKEYRELIVVEYSQAVMH